MKHKLLLDKCLEIIETITNEWQALDLGVPPQSMIIELGDGELIDDNLVYKELIATYLYENKQLKVIANGVEPQREHVSDAFFFQGWARIGIDANGTRGCIEYYLGPRFARSLIYEIVEDNDGVKLGDECILWVS
ncbi:MAG: hypothetical protein MJ172_09905 [Clostridia bacterium]|nr:hypothetical protein [Clostridia bacterium]